MRLLFCYYLTKTTTSTQNGQTMTEYGCSGTCLSGCAISGPNKACQKSCTTNNCNTGKISGSASQNICDMIDLKEAPPETVPVLQSKGQRTRTVIKMKI